MPHGKIACGRFLKPFGVRGELKFEPYLPDDLDPEALSAGVTRHPSSMGRPEAELLIASGRRLGDGLWALKPDGCDSPEEAAPLVNAVLWIDRSLLTGLGPNEYLTDDIIGCTVFDAAGKELGPVTEVYVTGANDVWALKEKEGGRELLVPAIPDVVKEVDTEGKRIVIRVPEGLFD